MIEIIAKSAILLAVGAVFARCLTRSQPARAHLVWLLVFVGAGLIPVLTAQSRIKFALTVPQTYTDPSVISNPTSSPTVSAGFPNRVQDSGVDTVKGNLPPIESMLWLVWVMGAGVVVARYAAGWHLINRVRRLQSEPITPSTLSADLITLATRIGLKQNWELRRRLAPDTVSAMTWGMFHPVVLLPHDVHRWSPERQEAVLLHELAHVRRRDFASQLLAEFVCALYWFNPLAWLGARAMREVAESAADDLVVNSGVKASEYASQLLQLAAELGQRSRTYARVGVSAMNQSNIENRLKSVLSHASQRRGITSVQALVTTSVAMLAVVALASLTTKPDKRSIQEQTEALTRMKSISLATVLYAGDYDDMLPYGQNTETVKSILLPYSKDEKHAKSPTPGGRFEFNLNVGGVRVADISQPATIPLWIERFNDNPSDPVVGFVDAKVAHVSQKEKGEAVETNLKKKFHRQADSLPLPKDYRWRLGQ